MKSNLITIVIVSMAITLLSVLGFHVRVGSTVDSVAVLRTTGITCGSCSAKITKVLETLKGVAITEVDVDGGWVVVGYDSKTVNPVNIANTVTGAGFGSTVNQVLTPELFKLMSGRDIGTNTISSGCCGGNGGGCGFIKKS
ncbi:MAG: heavy-metal-associated domain-containing protein [Desulfuromonadaceae bacterium]|nr:heavy-metal-associated domain-containing protein [Desulfuromonadaceae bacterium]